MNLFGLSRVPQRPFPSLVINYKNDTGHNCNAIIVIIFCDFHTSVSIMKEGKAILVICLCDLITFVSSMKHVASQVLVR